MDYHKNISYFFLPFLIDNSHDFQSFNDLVLNSGNWELKHDELKYLLKYVTEKLDSTDRKKCKCFHYSIKSSEMLGEDRFYETRDHKNSPEKDLRFKMRLLDLDLFVFSTSVCIMAFKINFAEDNAFYISNAQYRLKKITKEVLFPLFDGAQPVTLYHLAEQELEKLQATDSGHTDNHLFYFANPHTPRANTLTILDVEAAEDYYYDKELFYLRNCYSDGFVYNESDAGNANETFTPSTDMIWGITPEAAVCLTICGKGREQFIKNTFFRNFNTQYLFMYVLLLHQKYALYNFMMKVNTDINNNIELLEEYRNQLYLFETDFVFSRITEVPQYQKLYSKIYAALSLDELFKDVLEPLKALAELRRKAFEDETKKKEAEKAEKEANKEKRLSRSVNMLSLLVVFSALTDCFDFIEKVSKINIHEIDHTLILQIFFSVIIIAVLLCALVSVFINKKS